jgi:hypothetical protein
VRRDDQLRDGGSAPHPRAAAKGLYIHDIYISDLHIDTIKVKVRNFH